MPHQCLNCGRIIPKGSDEILRGCKVCGGRKFIYVEAPLEEEKRLELKEKAERIREDILRRSDTELVELIKERGVGRAVRELGDGWVRVEESDLKPRGGGVDYEVVKPERKHPTAQELLREIDRKTRFREAKEEVRQPPKKKPRMKRTRRVRRKKERTPDVVTIVEQGVYEIDVKKLLEKSPIIVQKDGSYLIHLPSLFEMEGEEE